MSIDVLADGEQCQENWGSSMPCIKPFISDSRVVVQSMILLDNRISAVNIVIISILQAIPVI